MTNKPPMPPVTLTRGGRRVACKIPRQFQPHWLESMSGLPSQVRSPLRDALKLSQSHASRLRLLDAARYELSIVKSNSGIYSDSVDAKLENLGVENVDPSNPLQADAFVARLGDSGRKALEKCERYGWAIAYAELTIEWLDWELTHGH